ncbi:cell division suppressor protein YneA [Mesobacillus maritimus]|uniref:cell division suppressor protein YneA n=1 Tax=Mesobacillus maritimus TaxID=1643336 RepID=UPI003850BC5B
MKKIWRNNSYTILLIATSLILSLVLASGLKLDDEKYITVTVESGASLWEMAEDFSENHNLSKNEFVAWVERKNGISDGKIYVGDELLLPVTPASSDAKQYAGID